MKSQVKKRYQTILRADKFSLSVNHENTSNGMMPPNIWAQFSGQVLLISPGQVKYESAVQKTPRPFLWRETNFKCSTSMPHNLKENKEGFRVYDRELGWFWWVISVW